MSEASQKDAPAFDFYPERWLAGTAEMSDTEQIRYLRLLCFQWLRGGLPSDEKALARLAQGRVSPAVLAKFSLGEDGLLRNARLEAVRSEQRQRIISRRFGCALTNAKRHGIDSLSDEDRMLIEGSKKWRDFVASEVASEVASDTKATSLAARHHPPPTTHPVLRKESREPNGTWVQPTPNPASPPSPPSVEEALAFAESHNRSTAYGYAISPAVAQLWHDDRASKGWQRQREGAEFPIRDWKADLRAFAQRYAENERSKTVNPKSTTNHANGIQPASIGANLPGRYA